MQSYEEIKQTYTQELYDSILSITEGARPNGSHRVLTAIENLVDIQVRFKTNELRNELQRQIDKLTQRIADMDGIYP